MIELEKKGEQFPEMINPADEWLLLILEAKELGLSIEEVHSFILNFQNFKNG